ncbi:hypothetical protein N657DRAFT_647645 [Parathielavia appendiculata]|uniref:Uncharacterized protein n=1 Tax=Parathielavia appendiculata TaxID=2587402 RepID=A0AAN6TVF5_9PEZI|nr:hypothetical protein N657DRAFT_647645 [Parathielavia appendiculata]
MDPSKAKPSKENPSTAPPPERPPAGPSTDEPPAYQTEGAGPDPDESLGPADLVIHGRFIYPLGPSGDADSEPTYQLSRAIHAQGIVTEKMTFERLDVHVRTASDGTPRLAKRAKELYELDHKREMPHLGFGFQAWMEPRSRKTLGKVAIQKSPLLQRGYRAVKVVSDHEKRWLEKQGKKVDDGQYHFAIKEHGSVWQWSDPGGRVVATEVRERNDAGARQDEYRLRVVVPLPRSARDGLVALWCLWMWHIHVEENTPKKTWGERKRIIQMPFMS